MKLVAPTDFEILETLEERGRNTGKNISLILDRNRSYINSEMAKLASNGLVRRVGPAQNSGLYEITERGEVVLEYWRENEDTDVDFEGLIRDRI